MSATWKLGLMVLALLALAPAAWSAEVKAEAKADEKITGSAVHGKVTVSEPRVVYSSTTKGPFYYQNTYELRARKLARGVANVVLCPAEIPNQMFREAYQSSPVTGSVVGFFKGLAKGGKRLVMGTWEIVTFYNPGGNHYQPYVEPEVVFMEYVH